MAQIHNKTSPRAIPIKSSQGAVDQESTILAAWIFAEDNTFSPETEFEIDDQVWIIDDSDMG